MKTRTHQKKNCEEEKFPETNQTLLETKFMLLRNDKGKNTHFYIYRGGIRGEVRNCILMSNLA